LKLDGALRALRRRLPLTTTLTQSGGHARARLWAAGLSLTGVCLLATPAHADDRSVCAAAYEKGQDLRNKGEFTAAREELVACAKPTCKEWMVAECTRWLDELDRRQPTVVLTAETARGETVDIVKVTDESGRSIAQGATGRAIALDPGPHELTFVARDGSRVKVVKMFPEGQQAIQVRAVFTAPAAPTAVVAAEEPVAVKPSPWPVVGWVTGGVGLAGLGFGAAFGLVALGRQSSAHCDAGGCDPGTRSGIESAATLSTVGFVAGGVLLAAGVVILRFAPREVRASGLRIAPVATAAGGAMFLGGSF
jgi:hypothetical protein